MNAAAIQLICPYCGKEAVFMSTKEFYGKDYGANMYVCRPCNAYVGTHGKGRTPLGTMANAELREWRKKAHAAFDPLWKSRIVHRTSAYKWMAEKMALPPSEAHIGMFDVEKCKKLIEIIRRRLSID